MKDTIANETIPIIVILLTAILFVYVLTPHGSATTPDSLSYLDIAANIKNGEGFVETDFGLESFPNQAFKVQRLWPPLYPTLISISTTQQPNVTTVSRLSMALLSLTVLFIYLILKKFLNRHIALTAALALCISLPIISAYTYVWSETLFVPLLALAAWSSTQYLTNDMQDHNRKYIYFAALLISVLGLAFTRYVGIIFFLLLPVTYLVSRRTVRDLLWLAAASAVYGLSVGYLLLNNLSKTGSITGAHRPPSDKTLLENIADMYTAAHTLVPDSTMVLGVVFVISLLTSVLYIKFVMKNNDKAVPESFNTIVVLTFILLLYITGLTILRTVRYFDDLDVRFLVPVFPILWGLLFTLLATLRKKNRWSMIICTPVIFFIIAFPVAGYTQFLKTMDSWRESGDPKISANGEVPYKNYTSNHEYLEIKTTLSFLVGRESVLIANPAKIFEFVTGIPSVQLPDEIDLEKIKAINRLPERSIVLLQDEKQIGQFRALLNEHNLGANLLTLAGGLAIKTPIQIPEGK